MDGGPNGADASTGPNALAGFGAAYANATCERLFACCDTAGLTLVFGANPPATEAACDTQYLAQISPGVDLLKSLVAAGHASYNDAAGRNCVSTISATTCDRFSIAQPPAVCQAIADGHVAVAGACTDHAECVPGAYCDKGGTDTCVGAAGQGDSCNTLQCSADLYCATGNVCAPLQANGASCTGGLQCLSGQCTQHLCADLEATCPQ